MRRNLLIAVLVVLLAVVAVVTARTLGGAAAPVTRAPVLAMSAPATSTPVGVEARAEAGKSRRSTTKEPVSRKAPAKGTTARGTSAKGSAAVAAAVKLPARTGNARRVTFVNRTARTIWVAGWQQTPTPALTTTGWVLPAGHEVSIVVPDRWNGRFWGRTGCSFDAAGRGHCQTGDCAGEFQCHGYGSIPATLAEYNLNAWSGLDFYDVSMVDGSNLPMWINHTGGTPDAISSKGCVAAGCTTAVSCPAALRVGGGACESPCAKIGGDAYCCQGTWAPRSACDPTKWPVDYAKVFKTAEPYAYSYVDDDATSTFTCKGRCDYRITFGLTY